jgi:5-methylcytosine-specific restriction endonuclease McrA
MAGFRRYGYRRRKKTSSSERQPKPPRFPKGSLDNWEKKHTELNRLLQEAIAKDAAIKATCMPLRRQLAEINSRKGECFKEHRSSLLGFMGIYRNQRIDAEIDRLDTEHRQLEQRICAIAGGETVVREKWASEPKRFPRHWWDLVDLDLPLCTPHTYDILKMQYEMEALLCKKPSAAEDAAWKQDQAEQQLKQELKAQREVAKVERQAARKRKAEADRAVLAEALGKARDLADNVKRSLSKDHDCPYCGSDLGDQPHADHIYPLSKGGRSVAVNMVYVCAVCNVKKADMTLATFVATHRLDRDTIESRLQQLSKEY